MNRNNMMRGRGRGRGGASNPFVSGHMRNLDTEMELLQRKQDALQYEQQRLVNERVNIRKRPFESDQPSRSLPYYQTKSGVQNFAHLYDGGSERSFGGTQPKRRPPINVWDENRFVVNQSSVSQRHGSYVAPIPPIRAQPMPLMGVVSNPVGRHMSDLPLKRVRSKFYSGTQFNPAPAQPKNKPVPKPMQLPILRATEEPSKQQSGRLGLALGFIVKKMKDEYCIDEETTTFFNTKHMQRYIRKTIRERLMSLMLNRAVGKPDDIVAAYREVYPPHTDKHILDNSNVNADFDSYLKVNITRIMSERLDELFDKMKQLCEGKDVEVRKLIQPLINASGDEKTETNRDVQLTQEFMNSLTIALIEENLPQLLPKYAQKIIKMLDLESEITTFINKNMTGKRMLRRFDKKNQDNLNKTKVDESIVENDKKTQENPIKTDNLDTNEKEPIVEIENNENTQIETLNDVTGDNLDQTIEESKPVVSAQKDDSAQLTTPKPQQYFVKVLGQPSLPNRADAYKFFTSLNAVTIKKHKVIQNLLVVGFNNEQDYERAVSASDTVIGNCKLIIKTNDKQALSSTTTPIKEKTDAEKPEAMLSPDLENQITDLLSTIKKEQNDLSENKQPSDTEQADSINIDAVVKEEDSADIETDTVENIKCSPTKEFDDAKILDTIQEVDESNTESKTNDANLTNVTGKDTPMKKRQSVVTPRTIRTRRSSKLDQLNN